MKYHFKSLKNHEATVLEAEGIDGQKHQMFASEFVVNTCIDRTRSCKAGAEPFEEANKRVIVVNCSPVYQQKLKKQ